MLLRHYVTSISHVFTGFLQVVCERTLWFQKITGSMNEPKTNQSQIILGQFVCAFSRISVKRALLRREEEKKALQKGRGAHSIQTLKEGDLRWETKQEAGKEREGGYVSSYSCHWGVFCLFSYLRRASVGERVCQCVLSGGRWKWASNKYSHQRPCRIVGRQGADRMLHHFLSFWICPLTPLPARLPLSPRRGLAQHESSHKAEHSGHCCRMVCSHTRTHRNSVPTWVCVCIINRLSKHGAQS